MKNEDPVTLDTWHEDDHREFDDGQVTRHINREYPGLLEAVSRRRNVKVHIRYDCRYCRGSGKIDTRVYHNDQDSPPRLFSFCYCPVCGGSGYVEEWAGIDKVLR